jgi:uncharacterized protein YdiU (UPF0061 family)
MSQKAKKAKTQKNSRAYSRFKQINGEHSLKDSVFGSYVEYQVRKRHGGKVVFFNFQLAKDMGLIPQNHEHKLNKQLEEMILDTFAIIIINEYDQINNKKYPKKDIKPNMYMATRYLQLQHPGNVGMTSGDGRSIWNGEVEHNGVTWDVSSCGTGATCLSPATHKYNKFFKNGDPSISYGCGYSETDEGISTAFFSEIMYKNDIPTERALCVIEFEKNISIAVRAHPNLLRPSHFFNHLKQGQYDRLKNMTEYYIARQKRNGEWKSVPKEPKARYNYFLDKMVDSFAKITARLEDEYIFCWIDWDGDNILMDGGIIDYGSIRQFGLFHHEYRYDDVERFSTTIKEQKQKSKYMVQTFIQMVDYLITNKKKDISKYKGHKALKKFDELFEEYKDKNLLYKVGMKPKRIEKLYANKKLREKITAFRKAFMYFERAKSHRGVYKVADGISWDAIFCMRDVLRELPQLYLLRNEPIGHDEFMEIMKSNYAGKKDVELTPQRKKKINEFQNSYIELLKTCSDVLGKSLDSLLLTVTMRSSVINKYDRVTGDSITHITNKVMAARPKLSSEEIYEILEGFSDYQNLNPDKKKVQHKLSSREKAMLKEFFKIVTDCREGI